MQFPRFTDGAVGKLTFAHLNELFARLEALEAVSPSKIAGAAIRPRVVTAKIGAGVDASGQRRQWAEVELTTSAGTVTPVYQTKSGGLTSGVAGTGLGVLTHPAIGTFQTNQIVGLVAQYSVLNELFYLPVSAAAATGTSFPAKVESSSGGTNGIFTYSCKEVEGANFTYLAGAATISARNGAETAVDAPASLGVGFIPPIPSPILTRKAIKVGTVVLITQDKQGLYSFCVPNGYKVEC